MKRKDFERIAREFQEIDEEEQLKVKRAKVAKLKKKENVCSNLSKVLSCCAYISMFSAGAATIYVCASKSPELSGVDIGSYETLEEYVANEGSQQQKDALAKENAGFAWLSASLVIVTGSVCGLAGAEIAKDNNKEKRKNLEGLMKDGKEDFAVIFPEFDI